MKDQNLHASRAVFPKTDKTTAKTPTLTRLIARVIRTLPLATDATDFKVTLRRRLAALAIPYTQAHFDDAINLVASNRRLWR